MNWSDIARRWNEGTKTRAKTFVEEQFGPEVALKQAAYGAQKERVRVADAAGDVVAQAEAAQLDYARAVEARDKLKTKLAGCVQNYKKFQTSDPARAAEFKTYGEETASLLTAAEHEVEEAKATLDHAQAAATEAQGMTEAANRQYQDSQRRLAEAQRMQARTVLAQKVTTSLNAMYGGGDPDSATASVDGAVSMTERRYADAMGHQAVAQNSPMARQARLEAELTRDAGADLFAQALNAEDLNRDGIPDSEQDPDYVRRTMPGASAGGGSGGNATTGGEGGAASAAPTEPAAASAASPTS